MSTTRTLGSDIFSASHSVVTKISGIVYPRSVGEVIGLSFICNVGFRNFMVDRFNARVLNDGRCYQLSLCSLDELDQDLIIRDNVFV